METEKEKIQLELTTDDGYELFVEYNTRAAKHCFVQLQILFAQIEMSFSPTVLKNIAKWKKQKECIFACLQTIKHKDPKAFAFVSKRENGKYWLHEVFPATIIMEAPFLSYIVGCIKDLAKNENVDIIIPKSIEEAVRAEMDSTIPREEVMKAFDAANAQLEEGKTSVVVNSKEI